MEGGRRGGDEEREGLLGVHRLSLRSRAGFHYILIPRTKELVQPFPTRTLWLPCMRCY